MDAFFFMVTGVIAAAAAALVVTRRNPVYSAIYLVLFFTMISLDFLILRAPFLAVIQVLVYAGAIMVLFLFVIMLLNLAPEELGERITRGRKVFAAVASSLVFLLLATAIYRSPTVQGQRGTAAADLTAPVTDPALATAGETAAMGNALFNRYVLPFEYTSILIFVAIVAAVFLTKRRGPQTGDPATPVVEAEQAVEVVAGAQNPAAASGPGLPSQEPPRSTVTPPRTQAAPEKPPAPSQEDDE